MAIHNWLLGTQVRRRDAGLGLLIAWLCVAGCRNTSEVPPPTGQQVISVFVTIPPQAYFVERVGGADVHVDVLVGPGQSYHTYEPTVRQMADLARASCYFTLGVSFERPISQRVAAAHAKLMIVDTGTEVPRLAGAACDHDHGSGSEDHGHDEGEATDPHIWLNPRLAKLQAKQILEGMIKIVPERRGKFEAGYASFVADLDRVDQEISKRLAPYRGREIFVFHPSYGYFADAYGLVQVAVEHEGKEPSARQLAELVERAKKAGVRSVFVQPQFAAATAETLARNIGARVVPLDPQAKDYLKNLDDMSREIAQSLEPVDGNVSK